MLKYEEVKEQKRRFLALTGLTVKEWKSSTEGLRKTKGKVRREK